MPEAAPLHDSFSLHARHRVVLFVACLLGAGCGDDSSAQNNARDGAPAVSAIDASIRLDASLSLDARTAALPVADPDATVRDFGLDCPSNVDVTCGLPLTGFRTLLDARDYGAGARFIAMAGEFVLMQRGDRSVHLLRVLPDTEKPYSESMPPTTGDISLVPGAIDDQTLPSGLSGIDVSDDGASGAFVLAQDDSGVYSILRSVLPALVSVGSVPPELAPKQVHFNGTSPCVWGNQLSCLRDGQWRTLIPPLRDDDELIEVNAQIAVTRRGRWFVANLPLNDGFYSYTEQTPLSLTRFDLRASDSTCFLSGTDSLWCLRNDGLAPSLQHCSAGPSVSPVAVFRGDPTSQLSVLTGAGELLSLHSTPTHSAWCVRRTGLVLTGPVLDVASEACNDTLVRVLTAQQLVGQTYCANPI